MFAERILVLIPHPDDEVVGCAAAIARAHERGAEVHGLYLTTGVPPAETAWPWDRRRYPARVARRRSEAARAATILGLHAAGMLDVPSRRLKEHLAEADAAIGDALARLDAGMLWTPAWEGAHQDHDVANFLASLRRDAVAVWEFAEYGYAGRRVRTNEFPAAGPDDELLVLDAAEQAAKRRLLTIYPSERGNLAHTRTRQEMFRPLPRYDYGHPPHPPPLFWQRFQWAWKHPRVDHTRPAEVLAAIAAYRQARTAAA